MSIAQALKYFIGIGVIALTIIAVIVVTIILLTWAKESIDRFWENYYKRR